MQPSLRNHLAIVSGYVGLVLCAAVACQDTSAMAPIPGGFEPEQRIATGVQARLSEQGLGTLSTVLDRMLAESFPDGLAFPIASQCNGDTRICCADPDPLCEVKMSLAGSTVTAVEPRAAKFVLRSSLVTASASGRFMPVHVTVLGLGVDCQVAIDTARSGKQDLGLTGRLVFEIDPQSRLTRVSVANADILDLEDGDLEFTGGGLCSIANLIKPILVGLLADQVASSLSGLVEQQLCVKCPGAAPLQDECGQEATACTDGLCMEGNRCLQRLGVEGRMDPAAFLAGLGVASGSELDVSLVAGGFAMARHDGLNLGILSGLASAAVESAACVPDVPGPPIEDVEPNATLLGDEAAPAPYDLLLGVHTSVLDRIGWVLYRSGALCLDITDGSIDTSLLGALLPSLSQLLDRRPVPVRVSLRPTRPPTFALGANTFDSQTGELSSPLVELRLENAKVDVYALVHERFVRLAELRIDIALPLGLRVDSNGRLLPVPGNLDTLFGKTTVETSGLLAESPDAVARLTQEAAAIFLPLLTDSLAAFQLPTLAGLELAVEQEGLTTSSDGTFITVYAKLVPQQNPSEPTTPASCSTIPGIRGSKGLLVVVALILLCALLRKRGAASWVVILAAGGPAGLGGCGNAGPSPGSTDTVTQTDSETQTDTGDDRRPQPGPAGSHADMASQGNEVWVSGYEEKYGDLLVGRVEAAEVTWHFADGVPDAQPQAPASSYRGGVETVGPDVGQYSSIAISSSGTVLVAHHDSSSNSLRLTRGLDNSNGEFVSHEVDALLPGVAPGYRHGPRLAAVGLYTSLGLDSADKPIIAYLATGIVGKDGAVLSQLRVAWASRAQPTSRDDWRVEVVDSAPISCDQRCPAEQACVPLPVAEGEAPAGSRCFALEPCRILCSGNRVCVDTGAGPTCHDPQAPRITHEQPQGTGLWPSLVVLSGDELAVAYYDANLKDLRLARWTSTGAWELETLASDGDVGAFPSMIQGTGGSLGVAYQDRGHGRLMYRAVGGAQDGLVQIIDSGARSGEAHLVGADAKLLSTEAGLFVAYQDQTAVDLLVAVRDTSGAWSRSTLSGTTSAEGFYVCGAATSAGALFAHYILDATNQPLGRLAVILAQ